MVRRGEAARLGDLERAVMEILWARCGPPDPDGAERTGADPDGAGLTGREILAALSGRDLAYTTVMTVLDRLAGKRMVLRQRDGQAWRYRPAAAREAYIARLMLEALELAGDPDPLDGGPDPDRSAALVRFARSVSGADAALLRRALTEQAGQGDPTGEAPQRTQPHRRRKRRGRTGRAS